MKHREHKNQAKQNRTAALLLLAIGYLVLPFFSGLFAWTSDPYGPKVFFDTHHYVLHRAGKQLQVVRPFMQKTLR